MGIRWFVPVDTVEPDAVAQVEQTASLPFVQDVAVMPDVHYGKGSTVGTVVVTKGAVMPACVGVDIGCGMIASRTLYNYDALRKHVATIREGIERRIPVGIGPYGMNSRLYPRTEGRIAILEAHAEREFGDKNHMNQRAKDWRNQLGTLGGGNHFIEICAGFPMQGHEPGDSIPIESYGNAEVWVTLHSGSRGVGNRTGGHWTQVAQKQAKKFHYTQWLPNPDLAYLVEHTDEYWQYIKELKWCQMFAHLNREEMLDRVLEELFHTLRMDGDPVGDHMVLEAERINCHHNFAKIENHGGGNVLVTRKGAIEAREGMRGLIPGSMGDSSYIVTGLGHTGSFCSAPHGAGRQMSRSKARKTFTIENLEMLMRDSGIESRVRPQILDEHPGAYKDIDIVMHHARDLVKATHVLRQIVNVKGD